MGRVWAVGEELMARDQASWYRAKVIGVREPASTAMAVGGTGAEEGGKGKGKGEGGELEYRIHYIGWKARFDKWATGAAEADELRSVDDEEASRAALETAGDYEVESVVGKRFGPNGELQYRVQWRGYAEEEQTWEPLPNLKNAEEEVAKYEARTASVDLHEAQAASSSAAAAACALTSCGGGGGGGRKGGERGKGGSKTKPRTDGGRRADWSKLWPTLLAQGWREESGKRVGVDYYYLPPGISRSTPGMRCRRDFFDSKLQVRQYVEARQQIRGTVEQTDEDARQDSSPPKPAARDGGPRQSPDTLSSGRKLSLPELWSELVVESARKLNRSEKNIHSYVTPAELQLQLQSLGEPCARAVLRTIRDGQDLKVTAKRVQKLREQLVEAVTKCEGHNGAKAGLNAVAKVLCGQVDAAKQHCSKQHDLVGSAATAEATAAVKCSTTPAKTAAASLAKPPKKSALKEKAEREQQQVQGHSEVIFAEEVAAAAAAGAAAAAQAQVDTVAAGGIITDGLGLLSPFARGAAAGSPPLSLASPAERKRVEEKNRGKKKLVPEPPAEWARAEQLNVQLSIKHADQGGGAAERRSSGRMRTIQSPTAAMFDENERKDVQESTDCSGQKYRDLIGLARGFKAERVLPQDKTGVVPMPGVQTVELPSVYGSSVWCQPKSFIKAKPSPKPSVGQTTGSTGARPNSSGAVGRHRASGPRRQVTALENIQASGWAVDYECDSIDEAWLLSPEGGRGRSVSIGELEELIDLFERSHAHLRWVQPVTFETWADQVLGSDVRSYSGPWRIAPSNSPARERVVSEVALEHCYNHWSIRRKEFGCSLVRSLRDLQRPVRSNRSASPRYTDISEKDIRAMIAKEQLEQKQKQSARGTSQRSRAARNAGGAAVGTRHHKGRASSPRSASRTSRAVAEAECGLAVAAALERLVRQVEGTDLEESAQVEHAVERLVDRTARPLAPPATAPQKWVQAMKTEWVRERSERVARRRRQVLEAVAAIRFSRSSELLSTFDSLGSSSIVQRDSPRDILVPSSQVDETLLKRSFTSLRQELFKTAIPAPKPLRPTPSLLESEAVAQRGSCAKKQKDGSLWNHEDDVLLCQLYGYFFRSGNVARGRWADVSDGLGTTRSQNACRHRFNLIKSNPEMVTATADGASKIEQPKRRSSPAESGTKVDAALETVGCDEDSAHTLIEALHLAREGEMAAAERAEKKRRRGKSEIEKREEAGRRAADDAMVWTTAAEWAVRRAALKRRQHFGGVLVSDGTTDVVDDAKAVAGSVPAALRTGASHDAAIATARNARSHATAPKRALKRKRSNWQSSPGKNKKVDLGDGVNTWRVAVQDGNSDDGVPRLATVAIGWETDPAKDPTEYVGKPIREFWYRTLAKEDETPSQIAKKHRVDPKVLIDYNQRRWYPDLQPSSRLINNTVIMVPTDPTKPDAESVSAKITATNYVHWRADYDTGEQVDLDEADVWRGFWLHRCHEEGWKTAQGDGDGYVGRRVRVARPGGGFIHATVVGYIGQGEDEEDHEMWHVIHDDGDDEDLWRHEVEAALRAWESAELKDIKTKYGSSALRIASGASSHVGDSTDSEIDLD